MSMILSKLSRMTGGDLMIELGTIALRHTNIDNSLVERGQYSLYFSNGLWRIIGKSNAIILGRHDYSDDYIMKIFNELEKRVSIIAVKQINKNDYVLELTNNFLLEFFLGESNSHNENGLEVLDQNGCRIEMVEVFNEILANANTD